MAGSKFQYDESGSTFLYFLLSFLALVLLPSSYYLWPLHSTRGSASKDGGRHESGGKRCHCEHCQTKIGRLTSKEPWKKTKQRVIKCLIVLGWMVFLIIAYKVANMERDYIDWDPFEILQVAPSASKSEIKRQYHKLSLVYHPDKDTGDEKKFMQLTKAYAALTDEEAKKNWEMYGNPDGPGAMSFGIALPSWIVEKENSVWVLGLYALVFMVGLPLVVGIWWYESIKYGGDQVLLDTTHLYFYFFHKTPSMNVKRALMILAASLEFDKNHNSEVVERPSDNVEVPGLIKELPALGEKNKERPLCFSYSVKARALIHSHLTRIDLPPSTLEVDKNYVVRKCPYLIHEMVQCIAQLTLLAHAGKIPRLPTLETLENVMKLSPMVVQALWDNKSPLLQLPHVTEEMLRHFTTRRRTIRSIKDLILMKHEDRRALLRTLSDSDYDDVLSVGETMPVVDMDVKPEVLDDEDTTNITAGAIVTVTLALRRQKLKDLKGGDSEERSENGDHYSKENGSGDHNQDSQYDETVIQENHVGNNIKKQPVWQKQKRGKKGSKNKKKPPTKNNQVTKKVVANDAKSNHTESSRKEGKEREKRGASGDASSEEESDAEESVPKKESEHESDSEALDRSSSDDDINETVKEYHRETQVVEEDDDEDWEKLQAKIGRKEKILETKSKISHPVHCPFFPEDKQEYWWAYIADKKHHILMTPPYQVTNLVETAEVQLKFTAPYKPGVYHYVAALRSDSYLDVDVTKTFKLDVAEAKEVDMNNPQWEFSDEDPEEEEGGSDLSELTTDDEDEATDRG